MQELSDRLRVARQLANLSQDALAAAIGVSTRTLGRYENGAATPNDAVLLRIADATGMDYSWLKTGTSSDEKITSPPIPTPVPHSHGNVLISDIYKRLHEYEVVAKRFHEGEQQKLALAAAFNNLYGVYIQNTYERVFLESGSTLAYLAKDLAARFLAPFKSIGSDRVTSKAITNNAYVYLYLWLHQKVMCHRLPHGSPDLKYGGMFGSLASFEREPEYNLRPLEEQDSRANKMLPSVVREILDEAAAPVVKTEPDATAVDDGSTTIDQAAEDKKKEQRYPKMLILAAQSALQLSDDISATIESDEGKVVPLDEDAPLFEKLIAYRGFHVGSYQNKLFKRCLAEIYAPTIYFIHDEKIDCALKTKKCHFIYDEGKPWAKFIKEHPMSLWIGCTRESYIGIRSKCEANLTKGDWYFTVYGEGTFNPVVIGHNEAFREISEAEGVDPVR